MMGIDRIDTMLSVPAMAQTDGDQTLMKKRRAAPAAHGNSGSIKSPRIVGDTILCRYRSGY